MIRFARIYQVLSSVQRDAGMDLSKSPIRYGSSTLHVSLARSGLNGTGRRQGIRRIAELT